MATILSAAVLAYCCYLIAFKRSTLERERPARFAFFWISPLIYAAVVGLTNAWQHQTWPLAIALLIAGAALGLWRANSVEVGQNPDGKLIQRTNWRGLLPIMVLTSFWPVEWLSSQFMQQSVAQSIPKALALGLLASSLSFAIRQTARLGNVRTQSSSSIPNV